MSAYLIFLQKEMIELLRTYKLFLLGILFFALGIMNPLTAKFTPALLDSFLPEGMVLNLPSPSAMDSWQQFFKNVPQLGLVVIVLVFCSTISKELSGGTLVNLVTKGLSRRTILLSKLTAAAIAWTGAFLLCVCFSALYTKLFWSSPVPAVPFACFCLWAFGMLLLCIVLFLGVLTGSTFGALLSTGAFLVLLFMLNLIPSVQKYTPLLLTSQNTGLLDGSLSPRDFFPALLVSFLLCVISMILGVLVFNKKKL